MMRFLKQYSLYFAWIIALSGMLITLYLSEIKMLPVCHLCWYQRICMYPLVLILGIATYRNFRAIACYAGSLALFGIIFSGYQYLQQMFPSFAPIDVCGSGPSCGTIHMQYLGFITLPLLGVVAFVFILIFLWLGAGFKD